MATDDVHGSLTAGTSAESPDTEAIMSSDDDKLQEKSTDKKTTLIIILSLVSFCHGCVFSLQGPLFPKLAREKGLHPWLYSLVFGAFHLSFLIFIPIGIITLQRIERKIVLFAGTFVVGACSLLFGTLQWCPSGPYFTALAILVRTMEGFGAASIRVSSYAMVAARFAPQIWTFSVWIELFFAIGLTIGPIAGGALYDAYGFSIPFYGSGVLTLLAAVCAISILPNLDEENINYTWNFLSFFRLPSNLIFILGIFATSFYTGFLQAILEIFLNQFHLSGVILGLLFSVPVISHSITAMGCKWLNERWFNSVLLIFLCGLLISISILLISPIGFLHGHKSLSMIIGSLVLKGLGEGAQFLWSFTIVFSDTVAKGYPNNISTHCNLLGMFACSIALGEFLGSSLSGLIFETLALKKGTIILLVLELLPLPFVFVYAFKRNYRKRVLLATPEETRSILQKNES